MRALTAGTVSMFARESFAVWVGVAVAGLAQARVPPAPTPTSLVALGQDAPPPPPVAPDDAGEAEESAAEEPADPLELRVNRAVDWGCEFLLSKQNSDGSWHVEAPHPIGRTSLALLALLHGGVSQSDPHIQKGVDYLIKELRAWNVTRPTGVPEPRRSVYETGITLQLLYTLGPNPRFVNEMKPLAEFLARTFRPGEALWGYPDGAADLSNSQYALLGLRCAAMRDVKPDHARDVWLGALKGVLRCRTPMGGFSYRPGELPRGSMTVAGLAMIKLCEDELKGYGKATKDLALARVAATAAETWFVDRFSVARNPEGNTWTNHGFYYYLYGIERYAVFYDLKQIGSHAWYRDGAEFLLRDQNENGSWGVYHNVEDTAFSILFLRKAALTMPNERDRDAPTADRPGGEAEEDRAPRRTCLTCARGSSAVRFPGDKTKDDMLTIDPIGEAKARPLAKKKAGKSRWMAYTSSEDLVDLWKATSELCNATVKDWMCCYAAVYVTSDREQDAHLWLRTDDGRPRPARRPARVRRPSPSSDRPRHAAEAEARHDVPDAEGREPRLRHQCQGEAHRPPTGCHSRA
jgi:hypothetical protein